MLVFVSRYSEFMTPVLAARIFGAFQVAVICFQLGLALGVPWGELAMGGAFPDVYPPEMRVAALFCAALLAIIGLIVRIRAGLMFPGWLSLSRRLIWGVVSLLAIALVLNLITPSPMERLIWAPVTLALLLCSLRVACSR
jgi:hypothetical protein